MPLTENASLCQAFDSKNNCIAGMALDVAEITLCSVPLYGQSNKEH